MPSRRNGIGLVANPGNLDEIEREISDLPEAVGNDFQTYWDQGAALTVAEAVTEALDETNNL